MADVVLHLGFINTPYTQESMAAPVRAAKLEKARKRRRHFTKTMTAERVGDILEESYNLVNQFADKYAEEITEIIADAADLAFVDILPGEGEDGETKRRNKPFSERMAKFMQTRTNKIEKLFGEFLRKEEAVGPGIPTEAALLGKRRGYRTGRRRPSFIDTGVYKASFKAWADIK